MTVKERKYVQERVAGKSKTQAALEAGYSPATAHNAGAVIEARPAVREAFLRAMKRAGITDSHVAKRLKEGMDALKEDPADYTARHNTLKLVTELRGLVPKEGSATATLGDVTINVIYATPVKPLDP